MPDTKKKDGGRRDVVSEAVGDAVALKRLAVDAAKNELIESMAPRIRRLVEQELRGPAARGEDVDRLRRAADGYGETEFEEGKKQGGAEMKKDDGAELDMESLGSMFPAISEDPDEGRKAAADDDQDGDECPAESAIPTLGEGDMDEGNGQPPRDFSEDVDEDVEVSEAELRRVYEASVQAEAQVTKGFKDIPAPAEIEDAVKDSGLADVKKGETHWEEKGAQPPAKKDWTVKEWRQVIAAGIAENKALRAENKALRGQVSEARGQLAEVNLFNAKVLHVQKMLQGGLSLTREQKRLTISSIDEAASINEVKKIYATLEGAFRSSAQPLSENVRRKPQSSVARPAAGKQVLRESGGAGDDGSNAMVARWAALAGLPGAGK